MVEPKIDSTQFGLIVVDGQKYYYDIVIGLEGTVRKRKKKLSKAEYGTSHILSLAEAKDIFEDGAEQLIIGTGQEDMVRLSAEAEHYLNKHRLIYALLPTPKAIESWNKAQGKVIGLFHVTC